MAWFLAHNTQNAGKTRAMLELAFVQQHNKHWPTTLGMCTVASSVALDTVHTGTCDVLTQVSILPGKT